MANGLMGPGSVDIYAPSERGIKVATTEKMHRTQA